MPQRLVFSLFLIVVALILPSCERSANQPLRIAVIADKTGPNASFGKQLSDAADYANNLWQDKHLNLSATFHDDKGDPATASRIALAMVADPNVVAVVGHSTSATTRSAQAVYINYGMPLLAPIATYSDLTKSLRNTVADNVVRLVPSNAQQAGVIADFLARVARDSTLEQRDSTRAFSPVLLYYEPSEYGRDLATRIEESLWNKGIHVRRRSALRIVYGEIDMSQARADLRDYSDIGAIVFVGYYHQASQFVREISSARPSLPIILTDGAKDDKLFERLGPVPTNLYPPVA